MRGSADFRDWIDPVVSVVISHFSARSLSKAFTQYLVYRIGATRI
jgi:hypothetical protein